MAEEVSNQEVNEVVEPTPVELEARESGWVPKEDYLKKDGAEEHKWVDAGEFLRRGELFKRIEDQSKQLKDVRSALNEMKKLHSQVREVEYKRAIDALKAQKKSALVDGDADAVVDIDDRIDLVKEEIRKYQAEPVPQETVENPEFTDWTNRNNWYKTNAPMQAFADALGRDLIAAGNSRSEVLKKVEVEVRKEFPHKFRNPNQDKPGTVESGGGSGTRSTGTFTLTDEERRVMNTFIRTGAIKNEKEYIEDLKKVRG